MSKLNTAIKNLEWDEASDGVQFYQEGDALLIHVPDLSKDKGLSSSGKTHGVAYAQARVFPPSGACTFGLNVYRKASK